MLKIVLTGGPCSGKSSALSTLNQILEERGYFEMDVYPFCEEYAIVEIELNDLNEEIKLPPLDFIKDVTDDKRYRNLALAKSLSLGM